MTDQDRGTSVMVTGAAGNLGSKLVDYLTTAHWCTSVVAVDRDEAVLLQRFGAAPKVRPLALDLTDFSSAALGEAVSAVDAIVHFAVLNPLPDSTWEEAAFSFDMTAGLLLRARDAGLRRFVFASSNHTLGRYKEPPLFETLKPGMLTTDLFAPGTKWETLNGVIDGYAYGAAKVFGERMCKAAAVEDGLSTVSIRVGWCQVGDNHPSTINAGGNPKLAKAGVASRSGQAELSWFRNMWLSTPDFNNLFESAILADSAGWPGPGIVVNGMSDNAGMAWDIEPARRLIGYAPTNNVWDHV